MPPKGPLSLTPGEMILLKSFIGMVTVPPGGAYSEQHSHPHTVNAIINFTCTPQYNIIQSWDTSCLHTSTKTESKSNGSFQSAPQ